MGSDLIATVLPKLDDYTTPAEHADPRALATAACDAHYNGDLGSIPDPDKIRARLYDGDRSLIGLLIAHPTAIDAIRAAALRGANHAHYANTHGSYGEVFHASDIGGPDVIILGGDAWGADPYEGFRDVAVLAALLAQNPATTAVPPSARGAEA